MVEEKAKIAAAPKAAAKPKAEKPAAKPASEKKAAPASKTGASAQKLIAVIRIRGLSGLHPKRAYTMEMLNLHRSNQCTLIQMSPQYAGMLHECKDYVTWGPLSEKLLLAMLTKRGEIEGKLLRDVKKPEEIKAIAAELMAGKSMRQIGIKRSIRLTPPSGGLKGKKANYPHGELGGRESIDTLLKRMI